MSELYPTPSRRRRLEQVARGEVYRDEVGCWHKPTGFKVSAEMAALEAVGWVEAVEHPLAGWNRYQLTEAGRVVLAAPTVDQLGLGSVWSDRLNTGRRLRVTHVTQRHVEAQVTYSTEPDAWDHAAVSARVARREWTAHRYVPEPTSDGAR